MATGKWFYAAIASVSGVMLIFELHLLTLLLIFVWIMRIIMERQKKLFLFYFTFFIFFMFTAIINEQNNISVFDQGKINIDVTFNEVPQIDGNRLKAVVISDQE